MISRRNVLVAGVAALVVPSTSIVFANSPSLKYLNQFKWFSIPKDAVRPSRRPFTYDDPHPGLIVENVSYFYDPYGGSDRFDELRLMRRIGRSKNELLRAMDSDAKHCLHRWKDEPYQQFLLPILDHPQHDPINGGYFVRYTMYARMDHSRNIDMI